MNQVLRIGEAESVPTVSISEMINQLFTLAHYVTSLMEIQHYLGALIIALLSITLISTLFHSPKSNDILHVRVIDNEIDKLSTKKGYSENFVDLTRE